MDEQDFPPLSLDGVELQLQWNRLVAKMFDVDGEPVRLGHYELERELGRGAMGIVYVARDTKLDRRVAIKRLQARGDAELHERLVREAQAMAKLAHPNVVTIHEIREDHNGAFIVMEYVEGGTLRRWLDDAPRSIAEIMDVFVAAGRGLAAAHDRNLVHRDFKPDNVMVGADGRVRVMDFGLARLESLPEMTADSEIGLSSTNEVMTRWGALIGTPAYMAPEQLSGQRADAASDQFCYCVAFHEALYGERPFHAATLAELRAEIDAQRLTGTNAKVPDWLRELIVLGLKPAPTQRHASMLALLDAIEAGARKMGERQPPAYVFVAHAGLDKLAALRLCAGLLDHGVRPWIDAWDVPPSADIGSLIASALREAPAVLICCGRAGEQQLQREYGDVLQARIEAGSETVYRATLPGGLDAGPPSLASVTLDDTRWFEGVAELARIVGVDRKRRDWLHDEALRVGLVEQQMNPYLGACAYDEVDARWMFGRERETGEVLELVRANAARWLTVLGAPGSGKSSLVAAGVCPALRHGAVGGRVWQIERVRPGARPCESLAHALVNLHGPSGDPVVDALKVAQLRAQLLADVETLKLVIDRLAAAGATSRVLLVVDQLEQLFTVAGLTREHTNTEALSFVRNLRAATGPASRLSVMATLDREFMPRCLELPDLAQVLESGIYFGLSPMDKARVRDAVVRPARRVGFELEPELIDRFVDAETVTIAPGGRLQLLQQQLRELWRWRDETRRLLPLSAYEHARLAASSPAVSKVAAQPPPLANRHLDLDAARNEFRRRRELEASSDESDPHVVFMAKGVRKVYATHGFMLEGVDLILRRGEIVGLVGANGSGKTTLLRIIAGDIDIDGGTISYPSLAERAEWRKIRGGISHVQQQPARWYGPLQDTLRYEAALYGARGKKNDEEVEFMLHRLGLERYADSAWGEISVGFQTRFELARALMKRPQLLVLDEPLAALDVLTQQLYLHDLRDITSSTSDPPAVLISSQHLHEVESIADGVLALRRGKPVFLGKLEQLREGRAENSFELAFSGELWAARGAIARFGAGARLVRVGMNYVLSVPRNVTLDQVVRVLAEGALGLTYIRDISGSTRRLFEAEED